MAQTMLLMSSVSSTYSMNMKKDPLLQLQCQNLRPKFSSRTFTTLDLFKSKTKASAKVEDDIFGTSSGFGFTKQNELFVGRVATRSAPGLTEEGRQENLAGNVFQSWSQPSYNENIAMIGLDSMLKANSTLEDFFRSYFMFHGLDVSNPQSIFKYLPILSFTESYVYQLDNMNENLLQTSKSKDELDNMNENLLQTSKSKDEKATQDLVSFRPLVTHFTQRGLLTERIKEELKNGEQYWALERKLCHAITNEEEILIDDVMKAMHLRSFDYKVLNLLLHQLQETKPDELHMEFLSISEFLMEVCDDLYDYENDVLKNSFNTLRMFIGVYGASTAPTMLTKCITEAESKYKSLLKLLDPMLSLSYQERCAETKEDGKLSRHLLGKWSIPTVIQDEKLYRSNLKSDTCYI